MAHDDGQRHTRHPYGQHTPAGNGGDVIGGIARLDPPQQRGKGGLVDRAESTVCQVTFWEWRAVG